MKKLAGHHITTVIFSVAGIKKQGKTEVSPCFLSLYIGSCLENTFHCFQHTLFLNGVQETGNHIR